MDYLRSLEKGIYSFGTWNVQGLNNIMKKDEVFNEIERENIDLVVLTETKLKGSGQEDTLKYRHFYNGVKTDSARAGVSIIVKKSLGQFEKVECKKSDSQECGQTETMHERIITGRLNIGGREIIIIGVYWVNDTDDRKIKEEFRQKFRDQLNKWKGHELIILGDFNSKVGTSTESKVVGNFGDKEINNNGRRLIDVCEEFGLKIQNTFFDHEDIHKYTWYHRVNSSKSLIDFCITKQETTLHVHDVLACRWFECGTDHIFLEVSISFSTEQLPFFKTFESREYVGEDSILELRKYKSYLLYSKTIRDSYNKYLDSIIESSERSTEKIYNHLKETIHSAAYKELGIENKDMFGDFLWDKEIKDLRAKRKLRSTTFESNFGETQNEVWEGVCEAIDNLKGNKRSKAALQVLYQMLNKENKYTEPLGPRKFFNSDSNKYVPNKYQRVPKKKLQIDFADVTKALHELDDDDTWLVPGGITMQLLKNCSIKWKSLLKVLIQDIFMGKEMPSEIGETYEIGDPPLLTTHCIMRVMCFIVKEKLEDEIGENKFILPQLNHLDAAFTLRLHFQKNSKEKCQCVFINLKKLYLNVQYSKLFEILSDKYKISENLLAVLEKLIKFNTIKVFCSNGLIPKDPLYKGLVEQCILGPVLFKLYIQESVEQYINKLELKKSKCIHMISNDILIVLSTGCSLGEIMKILCEELNHKLNLSIEKQNLKYLGDGVLSFPFEIESENVMDFDGSLLEFDGSCNKEVYKRITATKNAIAYLHPVLRNESISIKTKSSIFNIFMRSILMDGCETWTLTRDMEKSINLLEKYFWKWCTPCNTLLANLKLGKAAYAIEVERMSKDKLPAMALKDLKKIRGKGEKWTDDIDEIKKNEIKYMHEIKISKLFYNQD